MNKAKSLRHDDRETGRTWTSRGDEHDWASSEDGHVSALLPFYVNGTLSAGAQARVGGHLLDCPLCSAKLRDWRSIAAAAATLPAPSAPMRLPVLAWDAITPRDSAGAVRGDFLPDAKPPAHGEVSYEGTLDGSRQGDGYRAEGTTILRLIRTNRRLQQELGREPTSEEIALAMELPEERLREILKNLRGTPADAASRQMLKEQMEDVLGTLSVRKREVLTLRFGLEDGRGKTLEEVGREFGVTRERIRQIEAKALRKLRHPSRAKKLKDFLDW